MSEKLVELQKALDEWWNDYNYLLGDASGDSECRQKLQRIVKLFSTFQKEQQAKVSVDRKQLSDLEKWWKRADAWYDTQHTIPVGEVLIANQLREDFIKILKELVEAGQK